MVNVLLTDSAVDDNSYNINYVTLDGILHEDIAINGEVDFFPELGAWAKFENNINKTGSVLTECSQFHFFKYLIIKISVKIKKN
jgi:hypothetical protein